MRFLHRTLSVLAASSLLAFAQSAAAQTPANDAPAAASALVAPKLVTYAEPTYPAAKLAAGERAAVTLTLSLDDTGKVRQADVQTSGGPEFDAAALEAAPRLVFEPASRNGKPIPSKIPFTFSFDFQERPAEVAPDAPKAAALGGTVRAASEDPLPGAHVVVTSKAGVNVATTTDANGHFQIEGLSPGAYHVRVDTEGFKPFEADEEVTAGSALELVYRPMPSADGIDIVVKGERPAREVTRRSVSREEVTRIPGTNGDALRSIESLPGVARPPGLSGLLIVRGSAPQDTQAFVDGTNIPLAYHFGGVTSVVPSEMLERIDFYPGNFSAEYGRGMGGIVDIAIRSPSKERYAGLLQVDMLDARALVEGPLGKSTRFLVAGRRSWVDAWLGPILEKGGNGVATAPRYYDYQAMIEHDISRKTTGRILFFGSDDRLALTLNSPSDSDPGQGGDLGSKTGFWRVQGRIDTRIGENVRGINMLSFGEDRVHVTLGDRYFDVLARPLQARSDWRMKLAPALTVIAGLDLQSISYDVKTKVPAAPDPDAAPGPMFAQPSRLLAAQATVTRPAAYAMMEISPVRSLKLLPGVRVDNDSANKEWTVDPRFAARWEVHGGDYKTTLKGGVGVFHQTAQPEEIVAPYGTPTVSSNRAIHSSVGVEQGLSKNVELSVEAFHKKLDRLVASQPDATESGVSYANTGSGRVIGAEVLLRYKADPRFFGWIAYTLSKSDRREAAGEALHPFQYDQRHIFTALGSYKLGRGWELGARWRYVSGNRSTPYIGGVVDYDAGAYAPIQSTQLYSASDPAFHRLDVRVEKTWTFPTWKLSTYLDVQNVYNRKNPEGVAYNYRYSQSKPIAGLPVLPIIGIRGEM
jgi:TonB family protein